MATFTTELNNIPNLHNQIKIAFFDIDETLIVKHKAYLPDSVLPALKQLKANGIIPAIASGRPLCAFPKKVAELVKDVGIDLFVTINGQYVAYQDKVIEKHPIPTEKIAKIVSFFEAHNIEYAFVSQDDICVSNITPEVKSALDPITTDYFIEKDYYLRHEVFQMLPFYKAEQDEFVENSGILDGLRVIRWDKEAVDLFDAQGSKARGIESVMHHFGLKPENLLAFGDGLNDLEMMRFVGVGVAMGNAHEQLKAITQYETDHIEKDGIANFLTKAGLI